MSKLFSTAARISQKLAGIKTYKQEGAPSKEEFMRSIEEEKRQPDFGDDPSSENAPDTDPNPNPPLHPAPATTEYTVEQIEEILEDENLTPQEREYFTNKWQIAFEQAPESSKPEPEAVPTTERAGAWMPSPEPFEVIISREDRDVLMEAFYVLLNHESDNPNIQNNVKSILDQYKGGMSNPNIAALKNGINKLLDKLHLNNEE